jgi:hypothetical protein
VEEAGEPAVQESMPASRPFKRMYIPPGESIGREPKRFKDQERYVRQFTKASKQMDFNNLEAMKRAENDPQSQGMPPRLRKDVIMW